MPFEIRFDYRFDDAGFFDDPERRHALEQAAAHWSAAIRDDFPEVPAGISFTVVDPEQRDRRVAVTLDAPIDDLLIFVGGDDLGGARPGPHGPQLLLGVSSYSGLDAKGDAFASRVASNFRGQGPTTDFEPWAGWISFTTNASAVWSFAPEGPGPGEADFVTAAVHEIGHVLGLGSSPAYLAQLNGNGFAGVNALAANGGAEIPLEPGDPAHVAEGHAGDAAVMDALVERGIRRAPGPLDLAMLADIGYRIDGLKPVGAPFPIVTEGPDATVFGTVLADVIDGLGGDDQIQGGLGDDALAGGEGDDTLFGQEGDDSLDGGPGADQLVGGPGNDALLGGAGDDSLFGQDGDDRIDGGAGADSAQGGAGADLLLGGDGNDTLRGQEDDDVLAGGPGDDILIGGTGVDRYEFARGGGADSVTDFEFGVETLRLAADIGFRTVWEALEAVSNPFANVTRISLPDGGRIDLAREPGDAPLAARDIEVENAPPDETFWTVVPSASRVAEGAAVMFTISRAGALPAGTVRFSVLPGEASFEAGDYALPGGGSPADVAVTFAERQRFAEVVVRILDDGARDPGETFRAAITADPPPADPGDRLAETGPILIEDAAPPSRPPTAKATDRSADSGETIPLASLFSFADPDGPGDVASFTVSDLDPGGGRLTRDGAAMRQGGVFVDLPIAELARWGFVVGPAGGRDEVAFSVRDRAGLVSPTEVAEARANPLRPPGDAAFEFLAKKSAYAPGTFAPPGYVPDGPPIAATGPGGAVFVVSAFVSATREPVLAIRGPAAAPDDWARLFDPDGPGADDFRAAWLSPAGAAVRDWLAAHPGAHLAGHGLGGAQAQRLAAAATEAGLRIGDVRTWNAPGIAADEVLRFRPELAGEVVHAVSSGDVASLLGARFLPGAVALHDTESFAGDAGAHLRRAHFGHWSSAEVEAEILGGFQDPAPYATPPGRSPLPFDGGAAALGAADFGYSGASGAPDPDHLAFLLALARIPGDGPGLAAAAMTREGVEAARARLLPVLADLAGSGASGAPGSGVDPFAADRAARKSFAEDAQAIGRDAGAWSPDVLALLASWTAGVWEGARRMPDGAWTAFARWDAAQIAVARGWTPAEWAEAFAWSDAIWDAAEHWGAGLLRDAPREDAADLAHLARRAERTLAAAADASGAPRGDPESSSAARDPALWATLADPAAILLLPRGDGPQILRHAGGVPAVIVGGPEGDVLSIAAPGGHLLPGAGADRIALAGGGATVAGTLRELAGDVVSGFGRGDRIAAADAPFAPRGTTVQAGSAVLAIDGDGDGVPDARLTLAGGFRGQRFEIASDGRDAEIRLQGPGAVALGPGADRLRSAAAADLRVHGGAGDDVVETGRGDDLIAGGPGDDRLFGGSGDDVLIGGPGADALAGGPGADLFVIRAGEAARETVLDFDRGTDRLLFAGFDGLDGFADLTCDRSGPALRIVGPGLSVTLAGVAADAVLLPSDVTFAAAGPDFAFAGFSPRAPLTEGDDRLHAGDASMRIEGLAGDDRLFGGRGADDFAGGPGDDALKGRGGGDRLAGGGGADLLAGGAGRDRLGGGAGDDRLKGGGDDDRLKGAGGADALKGGGGDDRLAGGGAGDVLKGGPGADDLLGGGGADALRGGGGPDVLRGGRGDDLMIGGGGRDVFRFAAGDGKRNVVKDFADGKDMLRIDGPDDVFGDLSLRQRGDDVLVRFAGGAARLLDADLDDLGPGDFIFG